MRKQARARRTRPKRLINWKRNKQARQLNEQYHYIVPAPEEFSFIENPSAVLDYLDHLQVYCQPRKRVLVDLKNVKRMTNCALLILGSKLYGDEEFRNDADIHIRPPSEPSCRRLWHSNLAKKGQGSFKGPQPLYRNRILGRRPTVHSRVEGKLAEVLIHEAMRYLTGQTADHPGTYRILTECMANSFKHADPKTEAAENWWVSSYVLPDEETKTWCFAFVDNGVGIFESIKLKGIKQKIRHALGMLSNPKILQMLLTRQLGSRTGLTYRGRGLPSIYKELLRGRIQNLIIIANDTHANLATNVFTRLPQPFSGTFVYWQVSLPPQV